MTGEKLELGLQREPQALERPTGGKRQASKCSFQLTGGLGEHRLEEAALRVVVVEQQLLVDARPSRDLLDARARKATPRKLLAGRHNGRIANNTTCPCPTGASSTAGRPANSSPLTSKPDRRSESRF